MDRMLKRPYRNAKVRTDRLKSVAELEKLREADRVKRAEEQVQRTAEETERAKPKCFVCGSEEKLLKVSTPAIEYYLCPVHESQLREKLAENVAEMRAAFESLGEA